MRLRVDSWQRNVLLCSAAGFSLSESVAENLLMDDVSATPRAAPTALLPEEQAWLGLPSVLTNSMQRQLVRLFHAPETFGAASREELIVHLRAAIALAPEFPELRFLLGMVVCVNASEPAAYRELRHAAQLAPRSFAVRLQMGELLMRLGIFGQAAEQTRIAAGLASGRVESELARRQAARIRNMQRDRPEHDGPRKPLSVLSRVQSLLSRARPGRRRSSGEARAARRCPLLFSPASIEVALPKKWPVAGDGTTGFQEAYLAIGTGARRRMRHPCGESRMCGQRKRCPRKS